jgi:redox-sensitive bicupin YhaK (pirin superfamily)
MIIIRKANTRGHSQIGWLSSYHTFSFGDYYNPDHMGFGNLRVINQDTVQAGKGFGKHPHKDMEIISYVISGSLAHEDSLGTGSVIMPGEIQRMSAGTGVQHSEFNQSLTDELHFLQIWIIPSEAGIQPGYEQKTISKIENQFILIGSPNPADHSVQIHQNVQLYAAYTTRDSTLTYKLDENHNGWVQLIKGSITLNGQTLAAGDGAAITDDTMITIQSHELSEFLFFDLG